MRMTAVSEADYEIPERFQPAHDEFIKADDAQMRWRNGLSFKTQELKWINPQCETARWRRCCFQSARQKDGGNAVRKENKGRRCWSPGIIPYQYDSTLKRGLMNGGLIVVGLFGCNLVF